MEQPAGELSALNDAPPPVFAANPTPTSFPPPPSHPSYAEMITAAIAWDSSQGKEGGSSKRAIAKYIDRVYSNLPPSHSALLTHHLKRLKNSGHLIMVKNSYQLSSAAPPHTGSATPSPSPAVVIPPPPPTQLPPPPPSSSSPNPTPKRGPGRPPKPKTLAQPTPTLDNGGSQPAKKRGRPPRQPQIQMAAAEVPFIQAQPEAQAQAQAQPPVNDQPKRRPGRPPKQPPVVPFAPPHEPSVNGAAPVAVVAKRRPGRPPKANVAGAAVGRPSTGRPRGRPKRTNALGPVSRPVGKRPRGRPPKQQQQQGGVVATVTVSGKRRGRPPKGSGPPKFRRLSGKPLGRPRKGAATSGKLTSGQGMANEELTRKLELIQSRVRDAVGILRPYVANENEALIALQQLEEVVAPNATEPPSESPVAAMPMSVVAPLNASVSVTAAVPPSINAPPPPPSMTNVPGLVMNAPAPFSVTLPPMTVTAPFHAPSSGVENQQPLSWTASSEAQS